MSERIDLYISGNTSFKAYVALKTGGRDKWSSTKKDDLVQKASGEVIRMVGEYFSEEKDVLTVLQWYCRGLALKDAIRKVYVDKEVAVNCFRS